MKNILNFFELPAIDMARATAFYERLLGGTIRHEVVDDEPNGILPFEEPGVGGALVVRKGFAPGNGALIYLNVNGDLEGAVGRVVQAGGSIVLPPTPPYPFGRIAVIVDSEGNHVGLHSD